MVLIDRRTDWGEFYRYQTEMYSCEKYHMADKIASKIVKCVPLLEFLVTLEKHKVLKLKYKTPNKQSTTVENAINKKHHLDG